MEEMKKTICRILEKIPLESIGNFSTNSIRSIVISREKKFGMHIIDSQRFICELNLIDKNSELANVRIFVKNRPNVHQEFNNMMLLWNNHYFKSTKYVVPKPLFLDEKNALLFMKYYEGERFLNIFYKNKISYNKNLSVIEKSVSDAALWLADFQSIYVEEGNFIPQDLLNFKENIQRIGFLKKEDIKRIIDKINNIIEYVPKFCNTYVHDQYLFRNIIYCENKVCLVDFPHMRIGWPLYDFYTFYLGIDRLQQYPFIHESHCSMMKEIFFSNYFEYGRLKIDRQIFDDLFFLFIIAYARKRYKKFKGMRGYMNEKFIYQLSRRLIKWSNI